MTGFGKSESMYQGASCVIEVRSVNNRFLDISCKLPKNLAYLENSFKNQIKDKLVRGSVFFSVTLGAGTGGNIPVSYNEAASPWRKTETPKTTKATTRHWISTRLTGCGTYPSRRASDCLSW